MKTINIELSTKSIQAAIAEIEAYKQALVAKLTQLVERLADIGVESIDTTMMSVAPADRGEYDVGKEQMGDCSFAIRLKGDQVLFIEFSSGITFGTNSFQPLPNNPNYGQGYGMGTYPSEKGHWNDPEGWWYTGRWGESEHTYGVRAYAPMYHADIDMRNQLDAVAKEVFGG